MSSASEIRLVWPSKGPPPERAPIEFVERAKPGAGGAHANWLFHADNALVLRALAGAPWAERIRALGGLKLVYLDPPFGVGADFELALGPARSARALAYSDRWGGDEAGTRWLDFLHERLVLVHALLDHGGALYLHVDARTSAWMKCLLDEIFGKAGFQGWIVWHMGNGARSRSRWSSQHNDILCYAKGGTMTFRPDVELAREPFAARSREMHFRRADADGRRFRTRRLGGKEYVYYEDEGRRVGSVWSDCPSMKATSPISAESRGYPTQKPERLLERILAVSTHPGDLVADFFCGSGTTLAVAQRLGRRWIGADCGAHALETTRARLVHEQATQTDATFVVLEPAPARRRELIEAHAPHVRFEALVAEARGVEWRGGSGWNARLGAISLAVLAPEQELDAATFAALCRTLDGDGEILCCDHAPDLHAAWLAATERGVRIAIRCVPRDWCVGGAPAVRSASFAPIAWPQVALLDAPPALRVELRGLCWSVPSAMHSVGHAAVEIEGASVVRMGARSRRELLAADWDAAINTWSVTWLDARGRSIGEWRAGRSVRAWVSDAAPALARSARVEVVDLLARRASHVQALTEATLSSEV